MAPAECDEFVSNALPAGSKFAFDAYKDYIGRFTSLITEREDYRNKVIGRIAKLGYSREQAKQLLILGTNFFGGLASDHKVLTTEGDRYPKAFDELGIADVFESSIDAVTHGKMQSYRDAADMFDKVMPGHGCINRTAAETVIGEALDMVREIHKQVKRSVAPRSIRGVRDDH